MPMTRRRALELASATMAATAFPHAGGAQAYPARTVTFIVPVGAGGAPDIFARLLGEQLAQRLGHPFIIENRPGVGGNLALQAVARAPADGHTILLMFTPHAVGTALYPDVNANLARDIAPVVGLIGDNFVLVATPSLPFKTLGELITYAKANPGKINFGSSGAGNTSHLAAEMFKMMAGVDLVHVPYRSTPAALTDVMIGNVQLMFDAIPSARAHIEAGKLRALGVSGRERNMLLPDVQPIAGLVPGYDVGGWLGVGVPRGTPQAVIETLAAASAATMAAPAFKAKLAESGSSRGFLEAAEFARLIEADTAKWAAVVKFAGIARMKPQKQP